MPISLNAQNNAYKGQGKPYIAALTGLDRQFGFVREFMPKSAIISEPGLYEVCNYDKKDRKDVDIYLIVAFNDGLEKMAVRAETAVEILKDERPIGDIAAYKDVNGKVWIRADGSQGAILWKQSKPVTDVGKRQDLERLLAKYVAPDDISLTQKEFLIAIVSRIQADL